MAANDPVEEALVPLGALRAANSRAIEEIADEAAYAAVRADRQPLPHALDAERAVLGGILLDSAELAAALEEGLTPDAFYRPAHGDVFTAVLALAERSEAIDAITVVEELKQRGRLDRAGGAAAIAQLEALLPTAAHVGAYARRIVEAAQRRRLVELAIAIAQQAYAAKPSATTITYAQRSIERIIVPGRTAFARELARAREEVRAQLGRGRWEESILRPARDLIEAEMAPLAPLVQGLIPQDAVGLIAGPPKHGKTWAVDEIVLAIANNERVFGEFRVMRPGAVAFFGLEDGERSKRKRWRALSAGRDLDPSRATARIAYASRVSIDLLRDDDLAGIIASCRTMPELPVLVVIDPLSDAHSAKDESANSDMKVVMRRARIIRDVLGCAVLIVHHMVKASAQRQGAKDEVSIFDKFRGASSIRGAYDVGIAYDPKFKSRNNFKIAVDVEVRDGQEPGPFGIELNLEDDEHRHVQKAWWTFHRDRGDMLQADEGSIDLGDANRVWGQLNLERLAAAEANRDITPVTAVEMANRLGKGWNRNKCGRLLKDLVDRNRARYLGPKGYIYFDVGGD